MNRGMLAPVAVVALAVAMLITALAHAEPGGASLVDRVAALVPRYGSRKVELVDAREFAEAVVTACKGERECVVRLVTMAILESGLSAAVSRSEYKPHEGDAYVNKDGVRVHRAWGTFQQHKSRLNAEVFGSNDQLVQARAARKMQLGALAECRSFRGLDPELGMWRVLSGRGCRLPFKGEQARSELAAKLRRQL